MRYDVIPSQLQAWLLQVHMMSFAAVDTIVWHATTCPDDARTAFQRHSHLYALLIEWFARHQRFLASPRTQELVRCLSETTRQPDDHRAFGRTLVHALREPTATLSLRRRTDKFAHATAALNALQRQPQDASDTQLVLEWIGLAECPVLLYDALELLLSPSDTTFKPAVDHRAGAASLLGWFYAFTSANASAVAIATTALETATVLSSASLVAGSAWLQRTRPLFASLPRLRLRIAWNWLLRLCFAAADSIQSDAAVADALESLEYAFRRFAPAKPTAKR